MFKSGIINKRAKLPNSRFCSSVLLSTKHKKSESFMNYIIYRRYIFDLNEFQQQNPKHFTQGRLWGLFFPFTSQREREKTNSPVFQAGCLEDIHWSILFTVGYENSSLPHHPISHPSRKREELKV